MIFENIKELTKTNEHFRHVIYTSAHSQVVLMSLLPGEDIGAEIHEMADQILVIIKGDGTAMVGGETSSIAKHSLIFVPAGIEHNIINTGTESMKLYTIYAPAIHKDGIIRHTKEEAETQPE